VKLRFALSTYALLFIVSPLGGNQALALADSSVPPIQYEVSLAHPERHLLHVSMKVPDVSGELTVELPAWNALYQIRDFSTHVQQVEARVGTEKAFVEKIDKQTWRVHGNGTIQLEYVTYWDEPGPFATQLNTEHAFINPAMVLLYIPGRTGDSAQLSISDIPDDWHAESALRLNCGPVSTTQVCAESTATYDAIADAPIEVGKFVAFDVPGVEPPVRVAVHGDKWDKKAMQEELRRICSYEIKLMEGAPFADYTFLVHLGKGAGGGGMEHMNSTAISVRVEEEFPNVAAHEFFHLWNVKRIRPATLEPVDYTKEQYTRALWFAEGVTSAYASYTLVRTGLWSKGIFYEDLGDQIGDLESRPANHWQSAEESSVDAWLEGYPLYGRPQNSISYYTKGQVLGVLLDILIRDRTENQKSLDDVMRAMNADFAKQNKTYRDSLDVRLTAEKVAGGSFEEFFQRYVAGAEPLPYTQVLALAGLQLKTEERRRTTLGFVAKREGTGPLIVHSVDTGSSAAQAGLRANDVILGWNGAEPPADPERWAALQKKGDVLRLNIRRDGKTSTLEIKLDEDVETLYRIVEDGQASQKARRIRDGLLQGVTQPVTASSR
jgi:predicted metalloprotease with PDZ domain